MNKFQLAFIPDEEKQLVADDVMRQWRDGEPTLRGYFNTEDEQEVLAKVKKEVFGAAEGEVFLNDTYQVIRVIQGDAFHLSIKRIDREPCRDWRDFQTIKNELIGPECEAVELYPAESRLVDSANQYHLWGTTSTKHLPFGFKTRLVSENNVGKSQQRKFV